MLIKGMKHLDLIENIDCILVFKIKILWLNTYSL